MLSLWDTYKKIHSKQTEWELHSDLTEGHQSCNTRKDAQIDVSDAGDSDTSPWYSIDV